MSFSQDEIKAMMTELGQTRYVVRLADEVYRTDTYAHGPDAYVVCDTAAHQDRVMSDVLGLDQAKGWAYGEHESWARRCLRRGVAMQNCYLINGDWRHGTACDCGAPEGD